MSPPDHSNSTDLSSSVAQPLFRPFNPSGPLRVYFRNLPHWRQPGATYFVTFRLDDSIPVKILEAWLDTRNRFYRAHGLNAELKDSNPDQFAAGYRRIPVGLRRAFEREQAKMLHEELDRCHGSCLLRNAEPRRIVTESLSHFHGQRLWLGDWVVMPNHVHALIIVIDESELEDLIGSIKKWTSRRINEWLATQPPKIQPTGPEHAKTRLWQHESYDRIVRDRKELTAFRRYIYRNPQTAKLEPGSFDYAATPWLDPFAARPSLTPDSGESGYNATKPDSPESGVQPHRENSFHFDKPAYGYHTRSCMRRLHAASVKTFARSQDLPTDFEADWWRYCVSNLASTLP